MAIAGKGGGVFLGANKVAEIEKWTLDIQANMIDITTFDSAGWKNFIAGLKEWNGSFDGLWKVSGDTTGQKALQDALLGGTSVSIKLDFNGTNNFTGTAFVKGQKMETPVGDAVKVSFDFQGSGAPAYT